MSRTYFRQIPNIEYINLDSEQKNIGEFVQTKNLFKRVKLRDDIFESLSFFDRYEIIGDDRPDNIANEVYGSPLLDWVILLSNNIVNIQEEWPLNDECFERVMLEKYNTYENLNAVHHYETIEVRHSFGEIIIPAGLIVPELINDYRKYIQVDGGYELNPEYGNLVPYFIEFYDAGLDKEVLFSDITVPITNYEIEIKKENEKRFIYVLKPKYLGVIFEDIDRIMRYKKGSQQYVTEILKRVDDIRLEQN
jgi:hypothetical protein